MLKKVKKMYLKVYELSQLIDSFLYVYIKHHGDVNLIVWFLVLIK